MRTRFICFLIAIILLFVGCDRTQGEQESTGDALSFTEVSEQKGEGALSDFVSAEESTSMAEGESAESQVVAVPRYSYALGLKSLDKTKGVLAIDGIEVDTDIEALKGRAQKLFNTGSTRLKLNIDESFVIEGVSSEILLQGYKIEVTDTITVTAATEVGLYYGARTVSDYIKLQGCMEKGIYTDWPDVVERTLHFDIARKYFPKDFIIQIIEDAAASKMNAVQLHFSENEGFRIECETDPAIMSDEYLTKDEVREIIAAAKELYVDIIPSFDSPGHLRQVLSVHPEYMLTDVNGYCSPRTLDITNPEAIQYIKSLLDEYAELFAQCKHFNIGGDESFGWSNLDRMQFGAWQILENHAKATYGTQANAHDAFVGYMNDIASHLIEKGFTVRAWNDGLMRTVGQAAVVKPNSDIEICYWTNSGTLRADSVESFINNGHSIYNVNESFMYYVLKEDFKQPKATDIFKKWNAATILGSDYETAQEVGEALKGAYFCIWCDRPSTQTAEEVKSGSARAIAAMAIKAWNGSPSIDYADFAAQFNVLIGA